ncbi:hypothetical protein [Rhodovulum sp. 12E13]|nr:hypothetical protein [Rhodovulum sp. 12E13]
MRRDPGATSAGARLGIRPEHVRIVRQTETDLGGSVAHAEPLVPRR